MYALMFCNRVFKSLISFLHYDGKELFFGVKNSEHAIPGHALKCVAL